MSQGKRARWTGAGSGVKEERDPGDRVRVNGVASEGPVGYLPAKRAMDRTQPMVSRT